MPYTTHAKVSAFLGVTLTAGQQSLVTDALEPAVSAYIDRFTGRSWGGASPVTGEQHTVLGGVVYLKNRPVTAITAATVRTLSIGSEPSALAEGSYDLVDAANGVLLVSATDGALLSVSYTHAATTAPADIQHAATMLVAAQLHDALLSDPSLRGVKQYAVGSGDLSITFDTQQSASYASGALDMLKLRRSFVFS